MNTMTKMKAFDTILTLAATVLLLAGCDRMNDIQEKFTSQEERTYLGKVDSICCYPGFGRAKIVWYVGADPRIENTVVYWNVRNDSIVKPFNRTAPGVQKDSIIVDNLPEGSILFEFRNTNGKGESSLYSAATVTTWGSDFADNLDSRSITSKVFDYEASKYVLGLSPCAAGNSVISSEVHYTDASGKKRKVRVGRDDMSVTLPDFPDGGELQFRSLFFLAEGIDTVYNEFVTVKAPDVIHASGTKLSIGNGPASRYFDRDGALYEWTAEGDLKIYSGHEGGLSLNRTLEGMVSRSTFRDFFFYDDDKFIGVKAENSAIDMYQLVLGDEPQLKTVKAAFGSSFTFDYFIAAQGFFYSLKAGTLRAWIANNDGTFGTNNGATISTTFTYPLYTLLEGHSFIVADQEGFLWYLPVSASGNLGAEEKIGQGWEKFERLVAVGNRLLAMDSEGVFWEFDFDTEHYWIIE